MGLFDSFESKSFCPICEQVSDITFQSKSFFNYMCDFKIGDVVEDDSLQAKDGIYKSLGYCGECKALLVGSIVIVNHKFTNVDNIKKEEPYDLWNIMPKEKE